MRLLLAAILLATFTTARAEITQRAMRVMCGSETDFLLTAQKYKEFPVYVGLNQEGGQITSLWVNLTTGTSTWVTQITETGEWCVVAVGTDHLIPDDSPLKDAPIGTRIDYK